MDILSKLEKVEIQITDRFPAGDMEYCIKVEQDYQDAFHVFSEFAYIAEETNTRIRAFTDKLYAHPVGDFKEEVSDCSESFIDKICAYFREKYAVTIEAPDWEIIEHDEYGRQTSKRYDIIPLQTILDSIYAQMGGLSFEEKAFDELKAGARKAITTYSGKTKYALKGVKLIVDSFYHSHKDSIFERYEASVEEKHRAFFRALSHFEYGTYDLAQKYQFLCGWRIRENEGVYDKHDISSSVISSIKVFKNGKVEFAFKDYRTAEKFMETYFPGIPQQSAA